MSLILIHQGTGTELLIAFGRNEETFTFYDILYFILPFSCRAIIAFNRRNKLVRKPARSLSICFNTCNKVLIESHSSINKILLFYLAPLRVLERDGKTKPITATASSHEGSKDLLLAPSTNPTFYSREEKYSDEKSEKSRVQMHF